MATPQIFGFRLDESGSNITELNFVFPDSEGVKFRRAIVDAFAFANYVKILAKQLQPNHKLELWDQAIKYRLSQTLESYPLTLVRDARLSFEGSNDTMAVWKYGIHILESDRAKGQRPWVLPDALLETFDKRIAIEFDHGTSIGNWVTQLIKAVRSSLSAEINGVLFCFFVESHRNLFSEQEFTAEFQELAEATRRKSIGIITVNLDEVSQVSDPSTKDIIRFFSKVYGPESNRKSHLKETASRIIAEIESRSMD